jgi:hypothetical protein
VLPLHVIKHSGAVAEFDLLTLRLGIREAFQLDENGVQSNRSLTPKELGRADGLLGFVYVRLALQPAACLHVDEIQAIVESVLLKLGETSVYRRVIMHRRLLEGMDVAVSEEVDWTPRVAGPAPAWRSLIESEEAIALGVPEFDPEADADAALRVMAAWICPWEMAQ